MKKGPLATQHSGGNFADLKIENSKHQTFNSDFEDNVDAVLVQLNQLGLNHCGETTLTLVEFDNARNIGANFRTRINLARCQFDFGFNLVVLDALVAFKDDPVNHRVFPNLNDNCAGIIADGDVSKQLSGV